MDSQRIFDLEQIACFSEQGATVTSIIETENSSIAVWGVQPQQIVQPHSHPDGQDTWVMLKGTLTYYLGEHRTQILTQGEVAIAEKDQVHGAINNSQEFLFPFIRLPRLAINGNWIINENIYFYFWHFFKPDSEPDLSCPRRSNFFSGQCCHYPNH